MDSITLTLSVLGVSGGLITILSFFMNRDRVKNDAERRLTEIEVKQKVYKEELDELRGSVNVVETKLMDKIDGLVLKFDSLYEKFIDIKNS